MGEEEVLESISQMKARVRGVSWKAEAMEEMKRSRNSGVGVEVEVVRVGVDIFSFVSFARRTGWVKELLRCSYC